MKVSANTFISHKIVSGSVRAVNRVVRLSSRDVFGIVLLRVQPQPIISYQAVDYQGCISPKEGL